MTVPFWRYVVRPVVRAQPANRGEAEALRQAIAQTTARETARRAAQVRDERALISAIERVESAERAARLWRSTREARTFGEEGIPLAEAGLRVNPWGAAPAPQVIRMPRQAPPPPGAWLAGQLASALRDFVVGAPGIRFLAQMTGDWEAVRREIDEARMLEGAMDGVESQAERPARALRDWETGLLLRDLLEGARSAPYTGPRPVNVLAGGDEVVWVPSAGWVLVENCGGVETTGPRTPVLGFGDGGNCGTPQPAGALPTTLDQFLLANGITFGNVTQTLRDGGPFEPIPGWREWQQVELWTWTGEDLAAGPGAVEGAGWTQEGEEAQPQVWFFDPSGLGAVSELDELRDELLHFQLPGHSMLPRHELSPPRLEVVQALREELELRETDRAVNRQLPETTPTPEPAEGVVVWPGGGSLVPEEHQWTRPSARVKEKKFIPKNFMKYAGIPWNIFTESNDFIRAIWDAIPRHLRTARSTGEEGNRRTDAMLRDIWNNFDSIDWASATTNAIKNQLEDYAYGRLSKAANSAISRARGGRGQGGIGSGVITGGGAWGGG